MLHQGLLLTGALAAALAAASGLAAAEAEPKRSQQYGGTRLDFRVAGKRAFVILPKERAAGGPWLWYAPTIGAHPNRRNGWLFARLLAKGFAVGGVDVGESFGSPKGTQAFDAFYRHVVAEHRLSARVCLLAQSRGGLMLYNWAAAGDNAARTACVAGIYPVCDLRSYPGLRRAAPAYGMTEGELRGKLADHNPLDRLAPLAKARVPILHLHGDADKVVPLEANSAELARRYKALGGEMKLIVVPGKGHAEVPEFFESTELLHFLLKHGRGREE